MADLRRRFIEDYAGGLLNVARQELSSTGEVLAQDGFVDDITLFVEDGRGVKSGLRLGSSLVECIDPVTDTGVLNVRTADRTYAKISDLKAFATAVASAQGALTDSVTESFANLEGAFETLEADVQSYRSRLEDLIDNTTLGVDTLSETVSELNQRLLESNDVSGVLSNRIGAIETTLREVQVVTAELTALGSTSTLENVQAGTLNLTSPRYYAITSVRTNVPAWVTLYKTATARGEDERGEGVDPGLNSGVILDVVTTANNLYHEIMPFALGKSDDDIFFVRAVNKSGSTVSVRVELTYIPL